MKLKNEKEPRVCSVWKTSDAPVFSPYTIRQSFADVKGFFGFLPKTAEGSCGSIGSGRQGVYKREGKGIPVLFSTMKPVLCKFTTEYGDIWGKVPKKAGEAVKALTARNVIAKISS